MKKYFLIILFNIIAVMLLLFLLEVSIRVFIPQIRLAGTSKALLLDSLFNSSSGIKSNSKGFSNDVIKTTNAYGCWKYRRAISNKSKKILFLGDSVTMGIGVENDSTFAGKINDELSNVDILNPSLIGYSSKDYLNVFEYFLQKFKGKISFNSVVIFWTLNDIYSNYPDKNSPEIVSTNLLHELVYFLRQHSKAYIFLKNLISDRSKAYYDYDKNFYTKGNDLFKGSIKNLEIICSKCDSLGISFNLFLLPYEYQIRNFYKKNIFYPQELLINTLEESNLKVKTFDCKEAFRSDYNNSSIYYLWGDGIHFSEKGHSIIAEFVKRDLVK
jgi:lysophospholipase L1-like esterase